MDMWRSLKTYEEVGYRYMIMPDHVPQISGRDPQNTAFAFSYGYIVALLQVMKSEPN
jgi:mannonate dehydratase